MAFIQSALNDIVLRCKPTSELQASPAISQHTQCYLPPDTGERAPPNLSQKG